MQDWSTGKVAILGVTFVFMTLFVSISGCWAVTDYHKRHFDNLKVQQEQLDQVGGEG